MLAFVGLVGLLYLLSVHASAANSDGATVVLEGKSLRGGDVTLSGWRLSFDSFWTVDAPFYAIGVAILGVRPVLLHLVPALIAGLVVTVGAALAWHGERRRARWAGALTVVGLLAFPAHALAEFFLLGPLHVGTTLWCLLAFAALALARGRWRVPLAACLLAAGVLGDLQTVALGVVPVFVAGLVAMARRRSWRAGLAGVVTALGSLALAGVVRLAAMAVGTFRIGPSGRASVRQMTRNVGLEPGYVARLLGVGSQGFGTGGAPAGLTAVHFVGLVAVVAAVLAAIGRLVWGAAAGRPGGVTAGSHRAPGDWVSSRGVIGRSGVLPGGVVVLDDLLAIAVVGDLAMFAELTLTSTDVTFARYLVPGVIFAAILAGRGVASILDRSALSPAVLPAAMAGGALLGCLAIGARGEIAAPLPVQAQGSLGGFLAAHGLYQGIGDYWTSSIITVDTREDVTVRPVMADAQGRLEAYDRQSTSAWYLGREFQFLVYDTTEPYDGVDSSSAAATFGKPSQTYLVGGYEILVWPQPVEVPAGA